MVEEEESTVRSFHRVSEQRHYIAQRLNSPGNGEVVYKVTCRDSEGNHADLETGRHILTKVIKF